MHTIELEEGLYFDSVHLMRVTREVEALSGVERALVAMATDANRELAASLGFAVPVEATSDRLLIALEHSSEADGKELVAQVREIMQRKPTGTSDDAFRPRTLDAALRELPDAQLGLVSVAGEYAGREADALLDRGLHVMIFSDNVELEEERRLKRRGLEAGLLVLGPDCGTAIVNGVPLAFANAVRRGPIGIVAASGTGLQEVSCRIHRNGNGVSQALGIGGRDLKLPDAPSARAALAALEADRETRVIVVISKPPVPAARHALIGALAGVTKPVVLHLVGDTAHEALPRGIHHAPTLAAAADLACHLATGMTPGSGRAVPPDGAADFGITTLPGSGNPGARLDAARRAAASLDRQRRMLRGLYCGGTLADETIVIAAGSLGPVASVGGTAWGPALESPHQSRGHAVVDLGEDVFTAGRPHPMIDPTIRLQRIAAEADDPTTAVVVLDFVLGTGSHEDPVGVTLPEVISARAATGRGGPVWIATIVGTDEDAQGLEEARRRLTEAGVIVADSNAEAAQLAVAVVEAVGGTKPGPSRALQRDNRQTGAAVADADAGAALSVDRTERAAAPVRPPRSLFGDSLAVVNIGLSGFAAEIRAAGGRAIDLDWRPPARGNQSVAALLRKLGR